jgi:hypothetical protein
MNKAKRHALRFFVALLLFVVLLSTIKAQANVSFSAAISSSGTISYSSSSPPTPTPTPTPNGNNLAVIPTDWEDASDGGPVNVHFDYGVEHTPGSPSIRLDAGTSTSSTSADREEDLGWSGVSPGDHIVFSAWVKISDSGSGDNGVAGYGIRLGCDFYAAGYITGIAYAGAYTYPTPYDLVNANYVNWGTSGWVEKTLDFIVPSTVYADGGDMYSSGQAVTPSGIIPWVQVSMPTDSGQAWFADATLYINP